MTKVLSFLALLGVSVNAWAAPVQFAIDPTHTASRFAYDHLGWTTQLHRFDKTTGKIVLDRETKEASVDVQIDVKSINTGFPTFNGQLLGETYFDAERYPTISFKSSKVVFSGDKVSSIDGELTIKGITKPVTLTVNSFVVGQHPVQTRREGIGANASAKIKRSDFNMGKQVPLVADEVELSFAVQAFKE